MTKKCSECGWEADDTETLPEDLHEDWCPQLTGKSRQWTENSIHASRDPAWAADEIERLQHWSNPAGTGNNPWTADNAIEMIRATGGIVNWEGVAERRKWEIERLTSVASAEMKLREGNFAEIERLQKDLDRAVCWLEMLCPDNCCCNRRQFVNEYLSSRHEAHSQIEPFPPKACPSCGAWPGEHHTSKACCAVEPGDQS